MRAVISVVGKDRPGILAYVATYCAERNINITDVTQRVLQDLFTMIMTVWCSYAMRWRCRAGSVFWKNGLSMLPCATARRRL